MEKLIFRLLLFPITTFFLLIAVSYFSSAFYSLYYWYLEDWNFPFRMVNLMGLFFLDMVIAWTLVHLLFEITNYFSPSPTFGYWLKILRYTPIAGVLLAIPITIAFDLGMVQYSKRKIRSYVYSNNLSVAPPDLDLHGTDRGWCGNGMAANLNYHYFETASAGFNDGDPYVRSRSLLASAEVRNWLNGGDRRFDLQLKEACLDEHAVVYQTAEHYLRERTSSCTATLKSNR